MIEISLTELALLIWAVTASGLAMHWRDEERKSKFMLKAIIEDPQVREQVVRSFEEFKAQRN